MCRRLTFLMGCILVLGFATAGVSATLLVHYTLDEAVDNMVTDISGNGYDGTVNGVPDFVEGRVGNAMEFFGSENVTLPAEVMEMTSYIGSVAFWMNADVPTGIYTMWWGGDNTTGGGFGAENEMHIHLESANQDVWIGGELSFFAIANPNVHLHSDPDKSGADDPGAVPVNPILMGDLQWHQVVGTWDGDGGSMKLYIDGLLVMEWPYTSTAYELSYMYLGKMANDSRTFYGKLDEVRIYSDVLTDVDVYTLYENPEVGVEDRTGAQPQAFALHQNYPNPFNPATSIAYDLNTPDHVQLSIYNTSGEFVARLVDEFQTAGSYSLEWKAVDQEGRPLMSGLYLAKLSTGKQIKTIRMLLLK
jgi:hypothetical protein